MNWNTRYAQKRAQEIVWKQLKKSFPVDSMNWVKETLWTGPVEVPIEQVNFDNEKSWKAYKEPELVNSKKKKIKKGKRKPVVLVDAPKNNKYIIIDGHHRAMAYKQLGIPMLSLIGKVNKEKGPWDTFHSKQLSKDPEKKV